MRRKLPLTAAPPVSPPCAEPFEVSDDADSVQMLTRSSQIGEFYVMMPPQVAPTGSNLHTADMLIYDEESDKHVRITWAEALAATMHSELEPSTLVDTGHGKTIPLSDWVAKAKLVSAFSSGKDFDNPDQDKVVSWAQVKDCQDIRIVVARPFIEHLMHNVILAVSGRDTGATLFGPADMQLSANTQVKTIEGALRACAHTPLRLAPMVLPTPPPAAERANCGAQATTPATSRPW